MQEGWREQTQAIFASAELGYKNTYYLTVTGRNDWPSQLAGPKSVNKSFFYPSIGGSVVLSELMPNLNKDYLSYMKVRGSWASVGNPFSRYAANPHFPWIANDGRWSQLTDYPMYDLKPERTNSWELGLSMRFLKNFNLDVTYYSAKTMNQTFNPDLPVSGFSKYIFRLVQFATLALNCHWDTIILGMVSRGILVLLSLLTRTRFLL